jgi:16S rRNA (guanine527-N7)-methyltransferase
MTEGPRGGAPRRALTAEQFATACNVSRETMDRFGAYLALLESWQARINLIAASTLRDPWRRHMLDSAQLAPLLPRGATTITDLGAGAGFPGLVLAILTGLETHLVESDGRKCAFLREAARITGTRIEIHPARIEALSPWPTDLVTARALAPLPDLLPLVARFNRPAALDAVVALLHKGARVEEELTAVEKKWTMSRRRIPSQSDPAGCILEIRDLATRPSPPPGSHDQGR